MRTKITIWNMALGFIGTRTIASEDEHTLEAIQCRLYWDSARRGALRDFPWNFAQRRAWLAEVPMPTGYERHYAHAYALPEDMLQALRVYSYGAQGERFSDLSTDESRFILVHDSMHHGQVLLCNSPKALLAYTADMEDVHLFDDAFVLMLARKLAALIAVSLLKSNNARVKELEELYRISVPSAVQADMNEGRAPQKIDSWLRAREDGGRRSLYDNQ